MNGQEYIERRFPHHDHSHHDHCSPDEPNEGFWEGVLDSLEGAWELFIDPSHVIADGGREIIFLIIGILIGDYRLQKRLNRK